MWRRKLGSIAVPAGAGAGRIAAAGVLQDPAHCFGVTFVSMGAVAGVTWGRVNMKWLCSNTLGLASVQLARSGALGCCVSHCTVVMHGTAAMPPPGAPMLA